MRAPFTALLLAVTVALFTLPPTPAATAKEHTAACTTLPSIVDRLRGAMVLASFHRGRGSSVAAYETLRTIASSVAQDREVAGCGVLPAMLARALGRAVEERTALAASVQIDLGIAAALSVALTGSSGSSELGAKLMDVPESMEYGSGCPDLFPIVKRLTGTGGQPLATRVSAVLDELQAQGPGRCASVVRLLTGSGRDDLAHAVDSLRLDETDQGGDRDNLVARCPELPLVVDRISLAISVGAPLYNKGEVAGCRDLYRRVARTLRDEVIPAGRCPAAHAELDSALTAAAQAGDPSQAAWALRRGFDRITEGWREPAP
jgi:hypothetical protein